MYEQEFTQKTTASEREKVLNQLALWALFKGPVSANLAAAILEIEEQQMKDLVDTYSSWFNIPESGKYQLYHERLKAYLLQKNDHHTLFSQNNLIIDYLNVDNNLTHEALVYKYNYFIFHIHLYAIFKSHLEPLKKILIDSRFLKKQFSLLDNYDSIYESVEIGIKYFGFLNDSKYLKELIAYSSKVLLFEYDFLKQNLFSDKKLNDFNNSIHKFKSFCSRIENGEEYVFKYLLNSLIISILNKKSTEEIHEITVLIKILLEDNKFIFVEDHISVLHLIKIIHLNKEIPEDLKFLFNHFRQINLFSSFLTKNKKEFGVFLKVLN